MKKIYLAALTLAMTACVSNDDLNPVDNYGYIDVNVSNDPVMVTRAEQTVSDLSGWTITADGTDNDYTLNLNDNKVLAGTYSITAKNATDVETANAADDGWGKAFYKSETQVVTVAAGNTTPVNINCGSAKNSKLTLNNSLNTFVFTNVKLHAKKGGSYLEMDGTKSVFYSVGTNVDYYITYSYNTKDESGNTKTENKTIKNNDSDFSINIASAATDYQISLSSTDNGTITVTIKYNDDFTPDNSTTLKFDAATGEKVTTSSQG